MELLYRAIKGNSLEYKILFKEVFGYWDANQNPAVVIMVCDPETENPVGFISGFQTHPNTFHLQYGGIIPTERKKLKYKHFLPDTLKGLRETYGTNFFTTIVENDNVSWIKMLIFYGFKIMGVRAMNGKTYVEFLKEL